MMDTPTKNHTFVRTVKAQDLSFSQVDGVLHDIKTKNSPTWAILSFAVRAGALGWVLRVGRLTLADGTGPAREAEHAQGGRVGPRAAVGPQQVAARALLTHGAVLRAHERRLLRRGHGAVERAVLLLEGPQHPHLLAHQVRRVQPRHPGWCRAASCC